MKAYPARAPSSAYASRWVPPPLRRRRTTSSESGNTPSACSAAVANARTSATVSASGRSTDRIFVIPKNLDRQRDRLVVGQLAAARRDHELVAHLTDRTDHRLVLDA